MGFTAGFIGLGSMGSPIAMNLIKKGVKLYVYNRTKDKTEPLVRQGAIPLSSPQDMFNYCDIVFSMVANDLALQQICLSENGLLNNSKKEAIHVSMSTISPMLCKELVEKHKEKNVYYVSCPVFGRPDAAENAKLAVCMAGDDLAKMKVKPLLEFVSQSIYDFGHHAENANTVKLSGNFLILNVIEALAEAFSYAKKSGVQIEDLLTFLTLTLFPSPVYKNYGAIISNQQYDPPGFKMDLGLKDINLLLRSADHLKIPLPLAGILHDRLMTGLAQGRENLDWSAIAMTQMEESGI